MKFKRIISLVLALILAFSCLVGGMLSAYATTITLTESNLTNTDPIVETTRGYDDNVWYYFKPAQSGTYTLYGLSSNSRRTEAYLFEKSDKTYTQLAYAGEDSYDDYEKYEGSSWNQFNLTYHLEAGKEYYYAAGWADETFTTQRNYYVRFICESYDSEVLESIFAECPAELTWYTDGEWQRDSGGSSYYYYNISKLIANMTVTLVYKDGSVLKSTPGSSTVGGYTIVYSHNQTENHWYVQNDPLYNGNILTVSVLDKSYDFNAVIEQGALFTYMGKVVDYIDKTAVSGAKITIGGVTAATTGSDGKFTLSNAPGSYTATVEGENIISRTFTLSIDAMNTQNNNKTSTPIGVACDDYNKDKIINGRDYVYIKSKLSGTAQAAAKARFSKLSGFTARDYEKLDL